VLASKCYSCHKDTNTGNTGKWSEYIGSNDNWILSELIDPSTPANSRVLTAPGTGSMIAITLTDDEKTTLTNWIGSTSLYALQTELISNGKL